DELLRLVEADVARQQERTAGVERDAAADEDLDEARVVRGDDQIARPGEVRAEAGGHAVHGGDDRLLEVPEGADDLLRRRHRVSRRARMWRRRRIALHGARAREVGARAEALPRP